MKFWVYILRTSEGTLYTGQTNNIEKRIKKHRSKKGSKYLRSFSSFELVYTEVHKTRRDAMKREAEVKSWKKAKKEQLVAHAKKKKNFKSKATSEQSLVQKNPQTTNNVE